MKIIDRYFAKEVLKAFSLLLLMVTAVYLSVDFFEKVDNFIEADLPVARMVFYYVLSVPQIMAQVIPISGFLAVLVVFGLMNRRNEIVALKGCGAGTMALIRPVVVLGVLATLVMFVLSEVVVPLSTERANRFWLEEVNKDRLALITQEHDVWIKDGRSILHFHHYSPTRQSAAGFRANFFNERFDLVRRIDAAGAVYTDHRWHLTKAMEQLYDNDTGKFRVLFHKELTENFQLVPGDLRRMMRSSAEMNLPDLREYIRKVESEGYDATTFKVDYQSKIAFPLTCLITVLLGAGISLSARFSPSLPVNISYGIVIAFCYWVLNSFAVSLGYGGMIPPLAAAWTANFVFTCIGGILLLGAR